MDDNKLFKNVIRGISVVIGIMVAEGIYRAGIGTVNKHELIGDGEIVSDKIEDEDIPF